MNTSHENENNVLNVKTHYNGIMGLYSGKKLDIFNFKPNELDIMDIFHPQTLICRFGGHIRQFYSVGQHHLLVEHIVGWYGKNVIAPRGEDYDANLDRLHGLMHDGSDSIMGDMPRPIKYTEAMVLFRETEQSVQMKINEAFGLPLIEKTEAVAFADEVALAIEANNLTLGRRSWADEIRTRNSFTILAYEDAEPLFKEILDWTPIQVKNRLFERFYNLTSKPYFMK